MKSSHSMSLPVIAGALLATVAFSQNVIVSQKAPEFLLNQYGGGTVSLNGYPGKTVFINFFGSY